MRHRLDTYTQSDDHDCKNKATTDTEEACATSQVLGPHRHQNVNFSINVCSTVASLGGYL